MVNYLILLLLILLAWILALALLAPFISKSKNFSFFGPALMLKVTKNRKILDRFARPVPKEAFSKLSVAIVLVFSLLAVLLLVYEAYLSLFIRIQASTSLGVYLALPIVNPYIPVVYGTFALIFAVVIHEVMHGIVSRKHGIKVKSVGALFFVIPIGAFVEPDQDEINATDPVTRRRIFAAGPAVNLIIAFVIFIMLAGVMMPSVHPIHDGVYVSGVDGGGIAQTAGIAPGGEVTSLGNFTGSQLYNVGVNTSIVPGTVVNFTEFNGKSYTRGTIPAGIVFPALLPGYPAEKANIPAGAILYSLDGRTMWNLTTFTNTLDGILPGTTIPLTVINETYSGGAWTQKFSSYNVTTVSKYNYYQQNYPLDNSPSYKHASFIGVSSDYSGFQYVSMPALTQLIFGDTAFQNFPNGFFEMLALPFIGYSPVPAGVYSLYSTPVAPSMFWVTVNIFYWVFWLDFLLGLMNALPWFVFDGGQFFKETLAIVSKRRRFSFLTEQRRNAISRAVGILVFALILWEIIVPRVI